MRNLLQDGLSLRTGVVTHFGQPSDAFTEPSDDFDYEYVMDCKSTSQKGPLAIALSNMKVQLRNKETLAMEYEFHAHNSTINEIWTSSQSPWHIATCSSDEYVKLWDLRSKIPTMVIPVGQKVWGIDIGCGDTLLVAGTDEKAHFFDVRKGNKLGEYGESHIDAVTRVRFHPTQLPFVVTASEDGVVCLFDCRIPNEDDAVESILNVESAVTKIGFFGTQLENIFCLTGTETLDLWNLQAAQRMCHFETIREESNQNGISTDYLIDCIYDDKSSELFLLSGDHSGIINVLNITKNYQTILETRLPGGHKACVRCLLYEDGVLYSGGEDSRLCAWTSSAQATATLNGYDASSDRKANSTHDAAGLRKARKTSRPY